MNPSIDAVALLPALTLTAALVVVFVADLVLGDRPKSLVVTLASAGTVAALVAAVVLLVSDREAILLDGAFVVDNFTLVANAVVLGSVALVLLIGVPQNWRGDYCVLILASALGMVLVASARDLITFFVAFELLAVPGYMLAGWNKASKLGHEPALKYYLLGVLATAILLYGLSFLYGLAGSTLFSDIANSVDFKASGGLAALAMLFVIFGMAFKISAVPFHFWAPDTYEGAPVAVAAFLSVASKAAGMVSLLVLLAFAFPNASDVWGPMLWILAAVSMTVGNLIALRQTNLLRMLAYSSIAQSGYLLIPLAVAGSTEAGRQTAIEATIAYLVIYIVTNVGAFAVAALVTSNDGESVELTDMQGLFAKAPAAAVAMSIFLLSLAGIPVLGGWFAKFVVLDAAIDAATTAGYVLAAVAAVNTAVGLVYYALVIRRMWLDPAKGDGSVDNQSVDMKAPHSLTLLPTIYATAALTVALGVFPAFVTAVGGATSPGL